MGNSISNNDALKLVQTYQAAHAGDPKKTNAVFFTVNDFAAIQTLITNNAANGFAVYNGMYPADGSLNPPGKNYSSRQTVVIVPTLNDVPVLPINFSSTKPIPQNPVVTYNHGGLEP